MHEINLPNRADDPPKRVMSIWQPGIFRTLCRRTSYIKIVKLREGCRQIIFAPFGGLVCIEDERRLLTRDSLMI